MMIIMRMYRIGKKGKPINSEQLRKLALRIYTDTTVIGKWRRPTTERAAAHYLKYDLGKDVYVRETANDKWIEITVS